MKRTALWLGLVLAGCSSETSSDAQKKVDDGGVDAAIVDGGGFDAAAPIADGSAATSGCEAEKVKALAPVDAVSTADVTVVSDVGGVKTLFIDASAGGAPSAATNPRVYVNLESATKVAVTDKTAPTSSAWDLAFKRAVVFTNGGDGGSGQGGATFLGGQSFGTVTAASADGKTFDKDAFVDKTCAPRVDAMGGLLTAFDGWYVYDAQAHQLTPASGTWLVRGASGKLFKVEFLTYYGVADGGVGDVAGRYVLRVAAL